MKGIIFLTFMVSLVIAQVAQNRINLFTMDCSGSFHGGMSERGSDGTDFFDMGMNLEMVKRGIDAAVDIIHDHIRCACPSIGDAEIDERFTPNVLAVLHAIHGINATKNTNCKFANMNELDSLLQDIFEAFGIDHEMMPSTCDLDHWQDHSHCALKIPFSDLDLPTYFQDTNILLAIQQCPDSVWPFVSISVEGSFIDNFFNPCEVDSDCGDFLSCGRIPQGADEYECREDGWWQGESYECDDGRGHCDHDYFQETEWNCYDDESQGGARWVQCNYTVFRGDVQHAVRTLMPDLGGEFYNCDACREEIYRLNTTSGETYHENCYEYIPPQECNEVTLCKKVKEYRCWLDDPSDSNSSMQCDDWREFCEDGYEPFQGTKCEDRDYHETVCDGGRAFCEPGYWEEWKEMCWDDESHGARWVVCKMSGDSSLGTPEETITPDYGGDFRDCNECTEYLKTKFPDTWMAQQVCDQYIPPEKCEHKPHCRSSETDIYSCWEEHGMRSECWDEMSCTMEDVYSCSKQEGYQVSEIKCDDDRQFCEDGYGEIYEEKCEERDYSEKRCDDDRQFCEPGYWEEWREMCWDDESHGARWVVCKMSGDSSLGTPEETITPDYGGDFSDCNECTEYLKTKFPDTWMAQQVCDQYIPPEKCEHRPHCKKDDQYSCWESGNETVCDDGRDFCDPGFWSEEHDSSLWCKGEDIYSCWEEHGRRSECWNELSCRETEQHYMEWEKEVIPWILSMLGVFSPDTECNNHDFCSIGVNVQNEVMAFIGKKLGGAYPQGYTSKLAKFCGLPEITEETDRIRHQQTMSRALSTISQIPDIPKYLLNLMHDMVHVDSSIPFPSSLPTSLRRLLQEGNESNDDESNDDESNDDESNFFENMTLREWTDVGDVFLNVNGDPDIWHDSEREYSLMQKTCNHQYNFAGGISLGLKTYFMKIPTLMGFAADLVEDIVSCKDSDILLENLRSRFLLFDPSFWLNMFGEDKISRSDNFFKDPHDFFSDLMFPVGQHTTCRKHRAEYTHEEDVEIFFAQDVENVDYYNCERSCWEENGDWKCDDWRCDEGKEYCETGYDIYLHQNCWEENGEEKCTDDPLRGFCKNTTVRNFMRNGTLYFFSQNQDGGYKQEENLRRECGKYFQGQVREDNHWNEKHRPNDVLEYGWDSQNNQSYQEGRYFTSWRVKDEIDIRREWLYDQYGNPLAEYMTCNTRMQVRKYFGDDGPDEDTHFSEMKMGCDQCYNDGDSRIYKVDCEQEWIDGPPTIANLPATCTLEHFIKTGQCAFIYNNISPWLKNKAVSLAVDIQRCPNDNSDFSVDIECNGDDCGLLLDMFSTPCTDDNDCPFTGKCLELEVCDPIGDLLWPRDPDNVEPEITPDEGTKQCSEKDECSSTQEFRNSLVKAILEVGQKSTSNVLDEHTGVCMPLFMGIFMEEDSNPDDWTFMEEDAIIGLQDSPVEARGSFTFSPTQAPTEEVAPVTKDPSELFVMDCSGGLHFRLKEGPFMRGGMNLGILKRLIDGVVDIVHDHVKCACDGVSSSALDTSWTPNVAAFINAMNGVPPADYDDSLGCPSDMMQFDKLLFELGLNISDHLPETCSIDHWDNADECSFKMKIPFPESLGDNFLYVVLKHCSESVWPFVSVSGQGPIFEDFMKPCSDDSDCGSYSCNHIAELPSYEECHCHRFDDDGFCACCEEDSKPHEDGRCKREQQPFVAAAIVGFMLNEVGVFRDQDAPFGDMYDESKIPEEKTTCTLCEITKNIKTDLLSWALESMFDEDKTVSQLSFCGLTDMIESVSFNRHQQTMSRISSHLSQLQYLSIKELLDLPSHELFGHGRSLLEDNDGDHDADHDADHDEDNDEDEMDLSKELEDVDFESWSITQDFTVAEKLDGTYWHEWPEEIPETDVVNMFRVTCDNELIIMGGTNKNGGGYFPNFAEIGKKLEEIIKDIIKCRDPLDSLSIEQIRARFLMFDPSFWLNIFTNSTEDLGPDTYDSAEWFREIFGEGEVQCIHRWNSFDPESEETYEEEEEITRFDDERFTSCDECWHELNNRGSDGGSCEIIKIPTIALPESCTLKTWMEDGMCSFIFGDILNITDIDVEIGFKLEKCLSNPGMESFEINCLGADCEKMTDIANTGCASDLDCPSYASCFKFPVCDPIGDLMWNATGGDINNPISDEDCPQNNSKCTNTANFQNQLVQLITKINGEDVSNVNSAHTGMCMPIDIHGLGKNDTKVRRYMEDDAVEITQDDVIHIKGLNVYYPEPTTLSPTTASPTTPSPTTASPTPSPTTESPTTESPTTVAPTSAAPTTLAPTSQTTTPASPTTASPTTASPTTASPTTASPTTASPTPAPTTAAPTTAAPTTASPTTASPTTAAPTTAAPTTAAPTTAAPTTLAPTTAAPTTPAPTTLAPTTLAPTTAAPTTLAPTTAAQSTSPTTASPTTASPTTASPTTASPTTASPTTASPTTASPTTASPTTASPTTASPTTASLTTASPTTPSPTTPLPTTIPTEQVEPPTMEKVVTAEIGLGINKQLDESELEDLKQVVYDTISSKLTENIEDFDVQLYQEREERRRHLLLSWKTYAILTFKTKNILNSPSQTSVGDNDPIFEDVTNILEDDNLGDSIKANAEKKFQDKPWLAELNVSVTEISKPKIQAAPTLPPTPTAGPTKSTTPSPTPAPVFGTFSRAISVFSYPHFFILGLTFFALIL